MPPDHGEFWGIGVFKNKLKIKLIEKKKVIKTICGQMLEILRLMRMAQFGFQVI